MESFQKNVQARTIPCGLQLGTRAVTGVALSPFLRPLGSLHIFRCFTCEGGINFRGS